MLLIDAVYLNSGGGKKLLRILKLTIIKNSKINNPIFNLLFPILLRMFFIAIL